MIALLASFLISTNATPRELVAECRAMIPANVVLEGRIVMRNRKGIVGLEKDYVLVRTNSATRIFAGGEEIKPPAPGPARPRGMSILGTDVTWSDISLDYLWWDDVSFDSLRESETVQGQVCAIVMLRKADRTVRAWIDRKTGALLQAEELAAGRPVRRLWGTRIKKFGDRWMANVMEVETLGSGHRTKITVEKLK